jgi:hypothetical protein
MIAASRIPIIVESQILLIFFTSFQLKAFLRFGGAAISLFIPRITLFTRSVLIGDTFPDARCMAVIDVHRLAMVETDRFSSAMLVRYNTTVSSLAGKSIRLCLRQNFQKCIQSRSYARLVDSEIDARANRSANFSSISIDSDDSDFDIFILYFSWKTDP